MKNSYWFFCLRSSVIFSCVLLYGCFLISKPVQYRLPITVLSPVKSAGVIDSSQEFANLFCSVLPHLDPGGDKWGGCGQYLVTPGTEIEEIPHLASQYRILVVPGIFGQCVSSILTTFEHAQTHLRDDHGVRVDYLDLPALGSSHYNGKIIANFVLSETERNSRRFIAVGYSKGAADLMEALANFPDDMEGIAALVTVAGSIGGSRVMDYLSEKGGRFLRKIAPKECDRGDGGALKSLTRSHRYKFLDENPRAMVPTYSIVAISTEASTSRVLLPSWRDLSFFALEQDSQMLASEAIVPGATYLGAAKGDHWAVAMPFEYVDIPLFRKFVNKNHYPREAFFEAMIRFVLKDLDPQSKSN